MYVSEQINQIHRWKPYLLMRKTSVWVKEIQGISSIQWKMLKGEAYKRGIFVNYINMWIICQYNPFLKIMSYFYLHLCCVYKFHTWSCWSILILISKNTLQLHNLCDFAKLIRECSNTKSEKLYNKCMDILDLNYSTKYWSPIYKLYLPVSW